MTGPCDYGRRFICPSMAGKIGWAFPKRSASPARAKAQPEPRMRSLEELKRVFLGPQDWKGMFAAAAELGRMLNRIDDIEAIGYVVRFCEDEELRGGAIRKAASMMEQIRDSRVLENIVMNADDDSVRRKAIDVLGSRMDDVTTSFTLVHIALSARSKAARFAALSKLDGRKDELRVVAEHSEYDDTKEYARSMLADAGG